jgi:hypothetical protein
MYHRIGAIADPQAELPRMSAWHTFSWTVMATGQFWRMEKPVPLTLLGNRESGSKRIQVKHDTDKNQQATNVHKDDERNRRGPEQT